MAMGRGESIFFRKGGLGRKLGPPGFVDLNLPIFFSLEIDLFIKFLFSSE